MATHDNGNGEPYFVVSNRYTFDSSMVNKPGDIDDFESRCWYI